MKQEKTNVGQLNTSLAQGNSAFREGHFASAIFHYVNLLHNRPAFTKMISGNMELAKRKYLASRKSAHKLSVAVCGWELSHNSAGRVYTLAKLYETFAAVEIIGTLLPNWGCEIWEPIRNTRITKHTFLVEDEKKFLEQAINFVASHPYDIVHLSKPRAHNIFFGMLYKVIWSATVLVDIDDEELAFVEELAPMNIDEYIGSYGEWPKMQHLAGKDWTRLAVDMVHEFDGVTVSNSPLQKRYGGEIIRHVRNENLFKPSLIAKRRSRQKFGIPDDKKIVLFFGTPREHKGLIETAEAIASLNRQDVMFVVVGNFPDASIKARLQNVRGCEYLFLDNQPFDAIPDVVCIADCCVLLQNNSSSIARFQSPAKLSDALGFGIPVLANKIEPLEEFFARGAVVEIKHENIAPKIAQSIDNLDFIKQQAASARSAFKILLSFEETVPVIKNILEKARLKSVNISPLVLQYIVQYKIFDEGVFEVGRSLDLRANAKQDLETPVSPQMRTIVAENADVHPDFFTLRASEPQAEILIAVWIASASALEKLIQTLCEVKFPFELHVLLPRSLILAARQKKFTHNSQRTTLIGFPEQTKKSGAFVRSINGGAFTRHENLLWLDLGVEGAGLDNRAIEKFLSVDAAPIGVLANGVQPISTSEFYRKNIGIWFARIFKQPPGGATLVPSGSFIVRNLLLKQFFGLSLDPTTFDRLTDDIDCDAFDSCLGVIGAFLNEGGLRISRFANSDEMFSLVETEKRKQRVIKTIAFFLPQFHVIPENNAWWGKGFTEWNNVVRAKPLFRSHNQPRLPADLGFYDLRSPATQVAQAHLAAKHGIHGFCYYYYWFNGKKLLNEPIEQMLESGNPDFPFCVCWANENWSRNWDGQNRHVLMEQNYSRESNLALIHEFIRMMKDSRYIRHNGKPVLLVYRIKIIPNWLETAALWREECKKSGVGDIHLCSIRFGLEPLEGMPSQHGLDSYVLFPPQDTEFVDARGSVHDLHPDFSGSIFSYDEVAKGDISRFKSGYPWPVHRGAMLGWDNTARRLTAARIFIGCTPLRYRAWLKDILAQEDTFNCDSESLLFVNAWNEWAEGTTLEPDQRYGTSFLEATRSALSPYSLMASAKSLVNENPPAKKQWVQSSYAKELKAPELPQWFEGKVAYNENNPSVLFCAHISGHQLFGGERSFLDVLEALHRMGFNIIVTLPSGNNKQYISHILTQTAGLYVLPYPQWVANRESDPMLELVFCELIAVHNISVVYSNTIVLIEPALAARRMKRITAVHARELITIDDSLRERIGLPVQEIIKRVFSRNDFVIGNSRATERIFARENRTYYVPNAVDANALVMDNKIGKKVRIGIVSSNIPKKGIGDFIEVAKLCQDLADVAEFVIVGPDNAQTEIWKKDISDEKLPSFIKFLGYRETPKEAMAELNILLNLSSFAESFGRTVAEAMAAKRPVIAYEWGALPELVQHGNNGFMAPFGDIAKIAEYVRILCREPSKIVKLGEEGFRFVSDQFSHQSLFKYLSVAFEDIENSSYWKNLSNSEISARLSNRVTVIIPVYNAPVEVKNCIESVIQKTAFNHADLLIINDGSSDPKITELLEQYKNADHVRIIHNDKNIGYTKTVNLGIKEAGNNDVVLLNSDTIVTPAWLSAMRASAYSSPKIGTVTAMSDNAGAFSFPVQGLANAKPEYLSHDEYAMRVIDSTCNCDFVDVPTGSGFCMYIRRDLINEIGLFDDVLFPRGYGEENDFCMRALAHSWKNIITTWAFVFHVRTASFQGEKEGLVKAGMDNVTKKYPQYSSMVRKSFNSDAIEALRAACSIR